MKYSRVWVCRLRTLMEERNLKQLEVSEKTGIAVSTLSRLSNNNFNRIDIGTLSTLADFFEIENSNDLFGFDLKPQ